MRSISKLLLAAGLAVVAHFAAPPLAFAQERSIEGVLTVVWGDPHGAHAAGHTRYGLALPDGRRIGLDVATTDRAAAVTHFGKRVRVVGTAAAIATTEGTAAEGAERLAVRSIERLDPVTEATDAPAATVTGRVLFILLKFKGDTQTPHPPSFFKFLTNPTTPTPTLGLPATINGFFAKTSWNRIQWRADVAGVGGLNPTAWFTLPRTKAQYAPCGWSGSCADTHRLGDDAMALADAAGVNLAVYDAVSFVTNNDLDCCAWGGGYYYAALGKYYGATWEPPWGQEPALYVHEFGHSIGLPHSGWVYEAYDSPWDEMSDGSTASSRKCGSYVSANSGRSRTLTCKEPGGGYITPHKAYLGWLPAANEVVIDRVSTRTVALDAGARPLGTTKKMIRICIAGHPCTGGSAHYLTVEARRKLAQYDKGLPGEGVVIHDVRMNRGAIGSTNPCFFNDQSGWAMPIDATPRDWRGAPDCDAGGRSFPNYALNNAQFTVGKKLDRRSTWGVMVEVVRATTTGYVVKVTRTK